MRAQDSILLKELKQPYKKVKENVMTNWEINTTTSNGRTHRYVKKSTFYWIMGLTVVIAAILLAINVILVYYIASGDNECKFVVPEGYVLSQKDDTQISYQPTDSKKIDLQQPNDDMPISDQTTSETIVKTSLEVTTTATKTSSTGIQVTTSQDVTTTATKTSTGIQVTTSQDVMTTATKTSSAGIPVTTNQDVTTTATKTSSAGIPVTTSQDVTTTAIRTSSTARPECPRGWMLTDGSSCYIISGDIQSWNKASGNCLGLGGYLAEINDAAENKFLVTEIKLLKDEETYWIGLTDEIEEGSWVWSYSNTTLTPEIYSNWQRAQPDNGRGNEHCVELTEELPDSWNDDQCKRKHYYICERDLR